MQNTIEKYSDTEAKIITVTPEKIIPEEVREEVVSLVVLKAKLETLDSDIVRWTGYRETPLAELAKIDGDILRLQVEKNEVERIISEALKVGVKEAVDVTPIDILPVEKVIIP